jgi:hypothetical protein
VVHMGQLADSGGRTTYTFLTHAHKPCALSNVS